MVKEKGKRKLKELIFIVYIVSIKIVLSSRMSYVVDNNECLEPVLLHAITCCRSFQGAHCFEIFTYLYTVRKGCD